MLGSRVVIESRDIDMEEQVAGVVHASFVAATNVGVGNKMAAFLDAVADASNRAFGGIDGDVQEVNGESVLLCFVGKIDAEPARVVSTAKLTPAWKYSAGAAGPRGQRRSPRRPGGLD
jgi:hypothetical protein